MVVFPKVLQNIFETFWQEKIPQGQNLKQSPKNIRKIFKKIPIKSHSFSTFLVPTHYFLDT